MPLDPRATEFLAAMEAAGLRPAHELPVAEARAGMVCPPNVYPRLAAIEDLTLPGPAGTMAARRYVPEAIEGGHRPGLVVFFHGGGWVVGSLESHHGMCQEVASASGCQVLSIDYRLAPEHKFPAAAEDAYAGTAWAYEQAARWECDPQRLVVMGDSAGGNLAAVVSLMARDRNGPPIARQVLIYPVTDANLETASYQAFADGYFLSRDSMAWFWEQYTTPDQRQDPYAAPLQAESLAELPPALVITAECDPLCDEGEAYAARLIQSNTPCLLWRTDGMLHGYLRRTDLYSQAKATMARLGLWLQPSRAS